ncbi:MAG: LamG-like jellyroll fold domain-containing protein [Luteolibacter sp.]
MKKSHKLACFLLASSAISVSAKTILLDVQSSGGDAPTDNATVVAAFQSYDSNVSSSATVTAVAAGADFNAPIVLTDEDSDTYTLTYTGGQQRGPGASGVGRWPDVTPILESYLFKDRGTETSFSISGMDQIPAGKVITLTVLGIGDNNGQGSLFTPTYAGTTLDGQITTFGSNQATETDSARSAQWQFISDGTTTDISFTWNRNGNRYSAVNGLSITSSDVNFGDVSDATLTAPGDTTFILGAPDVQLNATATFSIAGLTDVTALGSTVVTYASTDTGVATVSTGGIVTFVGEGTADITATVVGSNSTTVTSAAVTFNVEDPTSLTLETFDTFLITDGYTGDVNTTADSTTLSGVLVEGYSGFSYASDNTSVVTVDPSTGIITPGSVGGTANITGTLNGVSDSVAITVEAPSAITATVANNTLFAGGRDETVQVEATTTLFPFPLVDLAALSFASDNTDVATVDPATGVVTPGAVTGIANITATFGALDDTVAINVVAPTSKPATLLHRYSFSGTAGSAIETTVITDSVGSSDGVIVGTGAVFDATGTSLVLPGGGNTSGGGYVDLPNGIISGITDVDNVGITIETWVTKNADQNWMRMADFGVGSGGEGTTGNGTSFINLIAQRSGGGKAIVNEFKDLGGADSQFFEGTEQLEVGTPAHVVLTIDPETGIRTLYKDGVSIGTSVLGVGRSTISTIEDLNCWLGRSNQGDNLFDGAFDEFRIYSGVLESNEVAANFTSGPDSLGVETESFAIWSAANANNQDADGDFDLDGTQNGIEYFFGETGSGFTSSSPVIVGNQYTWTVSDTFDGTYTVQTSPDLAIWTDVASTLSEGTVTYDLPAGDGPFFVRLKVTPTPAP